MPTLESRKYGSTRFVTAEGWKCMQENGLSNRFRVIDDSDIEETIVATPDQIVDFAERGEVINSGVEGTVEKVLTRVELKAWLTEHDVPFNIRAGTDKLNELYKENK